MKVTIVALIVCCLAVISVVSGHGRLREPAGRATLWRNGYEGAVVNYDDTQLFCGGFERQYTLNGGKCGICGDPWDEKAPREHEDGGKYGRGIITGRYHQGDEIEIIVEITAHHRGYFEFKLCPILRSSSKDEVPVVADQECLDQHPIEIVGGSGMRYYLPEGSNAGDFAVRGKLPRDLTCERCVLQWHYYTANRWDTCSNGTSGMGCGNQETFRGCADITISHKKDDVSIATVIPDNVEKEPATTEAPKVEISKPAPVQNKPPIIPPDLKEPQNQSNGDGKNGGCQNLKSKKQQILDELTEDDLKILKAIRESRVGKYVQI